MTWFREQQEITNLHSSGAAAGMLETARSHCSGVGGWPGFGQAGVVELIGQKGLASQEGCGFEEEIDQPRLKGCSGQCLSGVGQSMKI